MDRADLPRRERKFLERQLREATLPEDVRSALGKFSAAATLDLLTQRPRNEPPFLIARLVRETSLLDHSGTRSPTEADLRQMFSLLANVFDPTAMSSLGTNLNEILITRIIAPQVPAQRVFFTDLHRVMQVMADPDPSSLLGADGWRRLLGLELPQLLIATWAISAAVGRGPVDLEAYLAIDDVPELSDHVRAAVRLLAGDLAALQASGRAATIVDPADAIYAHGPLMDLPLYRRPDGLIGAPSLEYVRLAVSPPALHIRLVRADRAESSRRRTAAVGDRFQSFLLRYAASAASSGWQLRDLDAESAPPGKVADIAIWPEDKTFVVILEAKAT